MFDFVPLDLVPLFLEFPLEEVGFLFGDVEVFVDVLLGQFGEFDFEVAEAGLTGG